MNEQDGRAFDGAVEDETHFNEDEYVPERGGGYGDPNKAIDGELRMGFIGMGIAGIGMAIAYVFWKFPGLITF